MDWAEHFAALGDRDRALALMRELINQGNPEWTDRAWLQIGLIRKSAGQLTEAVEAFTTLERVAPRSPFRREAQLQRRWPWSGSSAWPRPSHS